MKLSAIYVRVSTDAQAEQGTSLDTQVDACYKKAKELSYDSENIVIYRDEGESGADIDRPALNSLRNDVEDGKINDAIFCFDPDRLSRKLNYQLILEEEFTIHDVKLLFVNSDNKRDTAEGKLLFHMQGAVAEYERAKIKERTIRGKLAKARKGQIMPMRTAPYGYVWTEGELQFNESEVEGVKKVFDLYLQGFSMKEIGLQLTSDGFEARYGSWNASTIRNIINSETYIGRYWYNRRKHEKLQTKTKSGKNHAVKEKKRPKSDHILIAVPSIIDETTWQKAQAQKTKNTSYSKRNTKLEYLARGGYLHCVDCGRVLQNTSYTNGHGDKARGVGVYRCPNLNPRNFSTQKCLSSTIKAKQLDELIWNDLMQACSTPENYIYVNDEQDNTINIKREQEHFETQLQKLENEKSKILKLYKKDLLTEEDVEKDLSSIKKREQHIKNQLNILLQHEINTKIMTDDEKKEIIASVKSFFKSNATFEDKRFVFQKLIGTIDIKLRKGVVDISYKGVFNFEITHHFQTKRDS